MSRSRPVARNLSRIPALTAFLTAVPSVPLLCISQNTQLELAGAAAALALGLTLPLPPAVDSVGAEGGGWAEEGPRMVDLREPVRNALQLGFGISPSLRTATST